MTRIFQNYLGVLALFLPAAFAHQPHDPANVVATSPNFSQDQTLLVATDYLTVSIGVYLTLRSTDGGGSWRPVRGLANSHVNAIRYSPSFAADGLVLLANEAGVFRSLDRGDSWMPSSPAGSPFLDLAVSPTFAADRTAFAITASGIFESVDSGQTFASLVAPSGPFTSIAVSPNFAADRTLLLGTAAGGLLRSQDQGATWSPVTSNLVLPSISAISFSPAFASDRTVFAGTFGAGILKSIDGGLTWVPYNSGLTDQQVNAITLYPGFQQTGSLLAASATTTFLSTDRGASWTATAPIRRALSTQTNTHFRSISATKAGPGAASIFLASFEGLWKSDNKGQSWDYLDLLPPSLIRVLLLSAKFATDRTVYCSSYGSGTLLSTDAAASWAINDTGLTNAYPDGTAISPNFSVDHLLFAGIAFGLERTLLGQPWQAMPALAAPTYVRAVGISPNFAADNLVMIGTDNRDTGNPANVVYQGRSYPNQGLFLSSDAGAHWVPTTLGGPPVDAIAISPAFASDRTAFAASSEAGLFRSFDGGQTWSSVFSLATDPGVLQLGVSPTFAQDRTAFAGTPHSGIYESTDGGSTWALLPATASLTALSFAVSPNFASDRTLFIGTFQSGLLKSTDGGATFSVTGMTQPFVNSLQVSPAFTTDSTLFASTYLGVYRSTDAGASWTFTANPARQDDGRQVTVLLTASWSRINDPASSSSTYSSSTAPGAVGSINFFGTGFRYLALTGPSLGTATVTLDVAPAGSINFASLVAKHQQNVLQKIGLSCAPHNLTVTASANSASAAITLDALDVLRDGCPF